MQHTKPPKPMQNYMEPSRTMQHVYFGMYFSPLMKENFAKEKRVDKHFVLIHHYTLFAQYGIEKPSNFTDSLKKNPFWHVFLIKRIFHLL